MKIRKIVGVLTALAAFVFILSACGFIMGHEVHFDAKGGSPSIQTVSFRGSNVDLPDTPTQDGFIFMGWYWDDGTWQEPLSDGYVGTSFFASRELTAYARWAPIPIGCDDCDCDDCDCGDCDCDLPPDEPKVFVTVMFDLNGGDVCIDKTSIIIEQGTVIEELPTPVKVNYNFMGWYLGSYFAVPVTPDAVFYQDTVLHARWQIKEFTVSFNTNFNSWQIPQITRTVGTKIYLADIHPVAPDRLPRFEFIGWAIDGQAIDGDYIVLESDVELEAVWQEFFFVSLVLENNQVSNTDWVAVGDEMAVVPVPTLNATQGVYRFDFAGWYNSPSYNTLLAGTDGVLIEPIRQNIVLFARFIAVFQVSFIGMGAVEVPEAVLVREGESVIEPDFMPRHESGDEYVFVFWHIDTLPVMWPMYPTQNTRIYASWTGWFTVTFDSNGGTDFAPVSNYSFMDVYIPTPVRGDAIFAGWFSEDSSFVPTGYYTITGHRVLTARWNYEVRFQVGDYILQIEPIEFLEGSTVDVSLLSNIAVVMAGVSRAFDEWRVGGFDGAAATNFVMTGHTYLYASTVEVFYLTMNASVAQFNLFQAPRAVGYVVQLPDLTSMRGGRFAFDGWTVDGVAITGTTFTITQDTVITAIWIERAEVTIRERTVTAGGGGEIWDIDWFDIGSEFAPSSQVFRRDLTNPDWRFAGWAIDGEMVSTDWDYSFVVGGDMVVEALWQRWFELTIIYWHNNQRTERIIQGGEGVIPPAPERQGFVHAGWLVSGNPFSGERFSMIGDTTITALWHFIVHAPAATVNGARVIWAAATGAFNHTVTYTIGANNFQRNAATNSYLFTSAITVQNFSARFIAGDNLYITAPIPSFTVTELSVFEAAMANVSNRAGVRITSAGTSNQPHDMPVGGYIIQNFDQNGNPVEIYRYAYSIQQRSVPLVGWPARRIKRSFHAAGSNLFAIDHATGENVINAAGVPNWSAVPSGNRIRHTLAQFDSNFHRCPMQLFLYIVNEQTINTTLQGLTFNEANGTFSFRFRMHHVAASQIIRHEIASIGGLVDATFNHNSAWLELTFLIDQNMQIIHFVTHSAYRANSGIPLFGTVTTTVRSTFSFEFSDTHFPIPWRG